MVEQDKLIGTFISLTTLGFFVLSLLIGLEVWNNIWSGLLLFFSVIFYLMGGLVFLTLCISALLGHIQEDD